MKTIIAIMAILLVAGAAWGKEAGAEGMIYYQSYEDWCQTIGPQWCGDFYNQRRVEVLDTQTCWEYKTLQGNKAIESVGITDWELVSMAMRIDQIQGGLYSTPIYIFKRPKKCEAK